MQLSFCVKPRLKRAEQMTQQEFPLISVLVPVYNAEAFLPGCLDGILGQTYPRLEVLCVEDSSTDNSLHILQKYARQDRRVRVISCPPPGGVAQARNTLLSQASGEYIAFVDADDRIAPEYLARLYETARRTGADVVRCLYDFWNIQTGEQIPCEKVCREFLRPAPDAAPVNRLQTALDDSQVWLKLIKRSLIQDHQLRFAPRITPEDLAFEILLYQYAQKPVFISDHLYRYRIANPLSLSANKASSALGTLKSFIWLCGEVQRRQLTDAGFCGRLAALTLQAVRRMRKFSLPESAQVGATCRQAFGAIGPLLACCRLGARLKYRGYSWLARFVKDENLPKWARWMR